MNPSVRFSVGDIRLDDKGRTVRPVLLYPARTDFSRAIGSVTRLDMTLHCLFPFHNALATFRQSRITS